MNKIKYNQAVNFLGRNGMFKQSGLDIYTLNRTPIIELTPIDSRSNLARSFIQIPVDALPKVIKALQDELDILRGGAR